MCMSVCMCTKTFERDCHKCLQYVSMLAVYMIRKAHYADSRDEMQPNNVVSVCLIWMIYFVNGIMT